MVSVRSVTEPGEIYRLICRFDAVLPHLKEKIADYRAFSEKLARYAHVFTAVEKDEVCGFVVFYANDRTTKAAFVTLLACAQAYQGRGIGRFLMEQACRTAVDAGMSVMRLEVDLDNTGAVAFYNKLGFERAEEMPKSMYMQKKLQ